MKKKAQLTLGLILLVIAICFAVFALLNPEMTFPWGLKITYLFYGAYIFLMFRFLVVPLYARKQGQKWELFSGFVFLLLSILMIHLEITTRNIDIYTVVRGFVILGGVAQFAEGVFSWINR